MADSFAQDSRLISLTTPLGDGVLLLAGFSGTEAISRLFNFHLDLLTDQGPINFADIIGKSVTLSIAQADDTPRYFNGLVSRFAASGAQDGFTRYQMEVVPWTWMLTRYADCTIFHNKAVGDILQEVFDNRGFNDYKISLSGSYSPIEYCVQYRETDFNFISRLMEQNGIFYFFQHEDGKHTMVIADSPSIHETCPGQDSASYNPVSGGLEAEDCVTAWDIEQVLMSGKYTLTDYNFTTPSTSLLVTEPTIDVIGGNSEFELFDYPGDYATRGDGTSFVKVRMQELEAGHMVARGSSSCRAFTTGYKFDLTDHFIDDLNATYVLTEIQHTASVGGTYGTAGAGSDHYSNHFTCIPDTVPFRPARVTPKPFVQGPQTAVVVGKNQIQGDTSGIEDDGGSTEDIWVDKYGRVVVLFPWDREGLCSCRVRVSQEWAGEGWGSIIIPRVGQEVIVSFLEGDPDRPIITGRVYNASQTVPYALPDYQTRSTFMTRSSTGGSASTYNELRFEDKKGAEQIFVRGQYDYDTNILHDSRESIGNNLSLIVAKDQMESVGGDFHRQISGKSIETVGGDANSNVTGNVNQKVGQTLSLQVGENLYEKSGSNYGHQAGEAIHLKAGMTVVLEAGTEICLKVGGNFIDINPSGVSIVGTMVMINSGGSAGSGCGSSPTDPASPTNPDQADDGSKGTKMN
jgi:type VI secretion system secreted protein VgrG